MGACNSPRARVAAGPSGLLFMVTSLVVTAVVVLLEVGPVVLYLRATLEDRAILGWEWAAIIGPLLVAAVLCVVATVAPIRIGARRLWERELPNS